MKPEYSIPFLGRGRICGAAGLVLLMAALNSAWAQLVIDLPEVNLWPDTANQTFEVYIENSGSPVLVTGLAFNIQTTDGGPGAGGSIPGPTIQDVNIFSGTLFESNNNGTTGGGSIVPQVFESGTLTSSGTVSISSGSSKVATVTVDTAGLVLGSYSMTLDTVNDRTHFTDLNGDLYPTLVGGSISVVPEPEAALPVAVVLVGFAGLWRWGRRFGGSGAW